MTEPTKLPPGDYRLETRLSSPSLDFSHETFEIRVTRAIELNQPVDPYKLVTYNGETMRIMNLPTQDLRALSGYGHQNSDIAQRDIIPWPLPGGGWPYSPLMCRVADGHRGVWVDEEHLACPGCGMDFT